MKNSVEAILRKNGLKNTKTRREIYKYLLNTRSHPSVYDIYQHTKSILPGMSYATVYNVVNTFVEKGIIQELSPFDGKRRFDANKMPHLHLVCVKCGRIEDIPFEDEGERLKRILKEEKWKPLQFNFIIHGICDQCSEKSSKGLPSEVSKIPGLF